LVPLQFTNGTVHVKATYDKSYELVLMPLQAAVLMPFNDSERGGPGRWLETPARLRRAKTQAGGLLAWRWQWGGGESRALPAVSVKVPDA
jgi:hypothetical protein